MFEKIKNIISGIGYAIEYGGTIRNVSLAWANFPGLSDSEMIRQWLRPLLTDAATLALLTKTTVDDIVVQAAMRILDNNNAWSVVHGIARSGTRLETLEKRIGALENKVETGNDKMINLLGQQLAELKEIKLGQMENFSRMWQLTLRTVGNPLTDENDHTPL